MLKPGYYKISKSYLSGIQHHYWWVYEEKGMLYVQEDAGIPVAMDDQDRVNQTMEDVQEVEKITKTPDWKSIELTIKFTDEHGAEFSNTMCSAEGMRDHITYFPKLWKKFGLKRKKTAYNIAELLVKPHRDKN